MMRSKVYLINANITFTWENYEKQFFNFFGLKYQQLENVFMKHYAPNW